MKVKYAIRKFLMITGVLLFMLFLIPAFFSMGFNIGNITGIVFSLLIFIYGAAGNRMKQLSVKLREYRTGRYAINILRIIIAILLCIIIILTTLMFSAANNTPAGNETVIVPGCRVYGERPSLSMIERLDAAYEYLINHTDAVCIVSGGQGDDEDISEAECMYRYLVDKGIGKDRIIKEDKSTSTRENIKFSKEIIEEKGLNPNMAIATNEYHQYRVSLIARDAGVKNTAISAGTAVWLLPTFYVRELYGIIYEILL